MPTRAVRSGLGAGDRLDLLGLALAEDADLLGLGLGQRLDLRRLLQRPLVLGLALVALDGDRELGLGDEASAAWRAPRPRAARVSFTAAFSWRRVGLDLLLGDLPRAQLRQDRLDLAVAGAATSACRSAPPPARGCSARTSPSSPRRRSAGSSLRSWISWISVRVWPMFLKYADDHRVERLLDQPLDVAEALDDERRLAVVDVHDHRQRQRRLEGVLGDQRAPRSGSRRTGASRLSTCSTSG